MMSDDAPPDGGNANKPMRAALSAALRRLAEDGDGQSAETLELVVNALIDRALDGDVSGDQGNLRPHGRQDRARRNHG